MTFREVTVVYSTLEGSVIFEKRLRDATDVFLIPLVGDVTILDGESHAVMSVHRIVDTVKGTIKLIANMT